MSRRQHGYAPVYARYLRPFVRRPEPVTVVEVGILKGTGLAIWSDLFPCGRIVGLDIDLGHVRENMGQLLSRGAFHHANVELHEFDQLCDGAARLAEILDGGRIDVLIDDGLHTDEATLRTLEAALPHVAAPFVYFIEDHATIHEEIGRGHPGLDVEHVGLMTVLRPRAGS